MGCPVRRRTIPGSLRPCPVVLVPDDPPAQIPDYAELHLARAVRLLTEPYDPSLPAHYVAELLPISLCVQLCGCIGPSGR